MRRLLTPLVAVGLLVPTLAGAVLPTREYRLDPRQVSQEPTFVRRVQPAIVGLRVRADEDGPSVVIEAAARWRAISRIAQQC